MNKNYYGQRFLFFTRLPVIIILVLGILACSGLAAPLSLKTSTPRAQGIANFTETPSTGNQVSPVPTRPDASPVPPQAMQKGVPIDNFSDRGSNSPGDILKEIKFFAGGIGGGGGFPCAESDPAKFLSTDMIAERFERITLVACGFEADEIIQITIKSPDGQTTTFEKNFDVYNGQGYGNGVSYVFNNELGIPAGKYLVTFLGERSSRSISTHLTILEFQSPRIIRYQNDLILLYAYPPGEQVTFFVYDSSSIDGSQVDPAMLIGSQVYMVDQKGQLFIRVDPSLFKEHTVPFFVTLGSRSGEVHNLEMAKAMNSIKPDQGSYPQPCKDSPPTRLIKKVKARFAYTYISPLIMFSKPSPDSDVIIPGLPLAGTEISILKAPKCYEYNGSQKAWLKIKTIEGKIGWVNEGEILQKSSTDILNFYNLEPWQ